MPKPKFQWPPNSLPESELGPPAAPDYWKPQPRGAAAEPLAPTIEPKPLTSSPPHLLTSLSVSPLRHIETVFLGLTRPTFTDRAADANWGPDAPSSYCPRCAKSIRAHEHDCTSCREDNLPWDRAVRLARYEGLLRQAIHELKFSAWRRLGTELGLELGRQLKPLLADIPPDQLVIIPVPCTLWRRLSRGIDHTATLARAVRQVTGGTLAPALSRKHRRPQVGLSHTDRHRNVSGTMKLRGHPNFDGRTLLVVDDVRTTGATMGEACRALRRELKKRGQTPAAIWSCTLAVVDGRDDGTLTP